MKRSSLWLVALAALYFGAAAPPAGAQITFACGANICRVASDGTGLVQVTTDGSATSAYRWPSVSRDGMKMAWIRGNGPLYVGDASATASGGMISGLAAFAVLRPDGTQVAALIQSTMYTGLFAYIFDATGSIALSGPRPDAYSLGWSPDNRLLLPWTNPDGPRVGICVLSQEGGFATCGMRIASDPLSDLVHPAVSPDGTTLAIVARVPGASTGRIALYDYASHTFVRDLTTGTSDANPAWSPDGTMVAFSRADTAGGAIYVVPAGGGAERKVADGDTPSWGGASAPAPEPGTTPHAPDVVRGPAASALRAAALQRGTAVRGTVTTGYRASLVNARLLGTSGTIRNATVGRARRTNVGPGPVRITVRLGARGKSALRRARSLRLKLRVTVSSSSAAGPATLTRTVRLRRA